MKKLKSIILAFTFFAFSSTSLFSIHNEGVKAFSLIAFNLLKLGAAVGSDKFYREDNKDFNKIFKTYLVLDSIDSALKFKDESYLDRGILIYNLLSLFKKTQKYSNEISESEKKEVSSKLKKSLILLKSILFLGDGICSVTHNLSNNKNNASAWANIGSVLKVLARSIDTKKCTIKKTGMFLALLPLVQASCFRMDELDRLRRQKKVKKQKRIRDEWWRNKQLEREHARRVERERVEEQERLDMENPEEAREQIEGQLIQEEDTLVKLKKAHRNRLVELRLLIQEEKLLKQKMQYKFAELGVKRRDVLWSRYIFSGNEVNPAGWDCNERAKYEKLRDGTIKSINELDRRLKLINVTTKLDD